MPPSPLRPVKNNPSPLQLSLVRVDSRNVSCSANKSEKSNPTFNIGGGKAKYCKKSVFPKIYVEDCRCLIGDVLKMSYLIYPKDTLKISQDVL